MAQTIFVTPGLIARLAELCGGGATMQEICDDLEISDAQQLRDIVRKFNLELNSAGRGRRTIPLNVSARTFEEFSKAGAKRDIHGVHKARKVMQRLVEVCGENPTLIDNILNDLVKRDE